jgi:3-oxoacyl-[acyl-carrier-protein] synthase-1
VTMVGFPITAFSVVNALGPTTARVEQALFAGHSGLGPNPWFEPPFPVTCGAVSAQLPELPADLRGFDTRQARLAVASLREILPAVERARGKWGAQRVAIVLGTSTGGIAATELAYRSFHRTGALPPEFDLGRHHNMQATVDVVRGVTGLEGPGYVVSTACSSSGKVLGSARRLLQLGVVDAVLVGGVDTLCEMTVRGFHSLEVLSSTPCRPFSSERTGINLGEGGAFLLVERQGEGPAMVLGVGETSDAHHMSAPHPDGDGAHEAMRLALQDAGVHPSEVDHVNAHATGTQLNDAAESKAIGKLLGNATAVVATKGYTGHLLGAAGATELVLTIMAVTRGELPGSLGAEPLDGDLGIDVVTVARKQRTRVAISNSFAFGGSNVAVVLGAPS